MKFFAEEHNHLNTGLQYAKVFSKVDNVIEQVGLIYSIRGVIGTNNDWRFYDMQEKQYPEIKVKDGEDPVYTNFSYTLPLSEMCGLVCDWLEHNHEKINTKNYFICVKQQNGYKSFAGYSPDGYGEYKLFSSPKFLSVEDCEKIEASLMSDKTNYYPHRAPCSFIRKHRSEFNI